MTAEIGKWYDFLLQQMAAESYFEGLPNFFPDTSLRDKLLNGNNRQLESVIPSGLTRFTAVQADEFLNRFRIIHQWSDNPNRIGNLSPTDPGYLEIDGRQILANTGLSATLIKNIDEASPDFGTFTLSIRSSEYLSAGDGGDFGRDILGADGGIAQVGFALAQLDSLERYVEWLQRQNFLGPNQKIYVSGYSLGAHLATLFTELHPEKVIHAYTFNGAGRGEWNHEKGGVGDILNFFRIVLINPDFANNLATTPEWETVFLAARSSGPVGSVSIYDSPRYRWAMLATSLQFRLVGNGLLVPVIDQDRTNLTRNASTLITQIYGHAENGDKEYVANSGVHGPSTAVFIEDQPDVQGILPGGDPLDFGTSHSLTLLADSLAVMRLFQDMDPEIGISDLGKVFAAASSQRASAFFGAFAQAEGDSLERIVKALGGIVNAELMPMDVDRSASGFASVSNRDAFHSNLSIVSEEMSEASLHVQSLVEISPQTLISLTKNGGGIAFLYALRDLNPFAIIDDSGELYNRFQIAGANERELEYVHGSYTSYLTDKWVEDRAAMLDWKNRVSVNDSGNEIGGTLYFPTALPLIFEDADQDFRLNLSQLPMLGDPKSLDPTLKQYKFGQDENATLEKVEGGRNADHLFGQGGDDELSGKAGDDYLEGGKGNDVLTGGAGSDELWGGEGFDRYIYTLGDGHDIVVDADGLGRIEMNGSIVTGGARIGGGVYKSADGKHTFWLVGGNSQGATLLIDEAIELKGFSNGALGITLNESPPQEPNNSFSKVANGWLEEQGWYGSDAGTSSSDLMTEFYWVFGDQGDDVLSMAPEINYGLVAGGPGNDTLSAYISAESFPNQGSFSEYGDEGLVGGAGNDSIYGSSFRDLIYGDIAYFFYSFDYDRLEFDYLTYPVFGDYVNGEPSAESMDGVYFAPHEIPSYSDISGESWERVILDSKLDAFLYALGIEGANFVMPTYDDYLEGGGGDDRILAGLGSDTIFGGAGDDFIDGDSYPYFSYGQDWQYFSQSWDWMIAELGDELPIYLLGEPGDDWLDGGEGSDGLWDIWNGNDVLLGGEGNDHLLSVDQSDLVGYVNYLDGGEGNDTISSGNYSSHGKDILLGGLGDDYLQNFYSVTNLAASSVNAEIEMSDVQGSEHYLIWLHSGMRVSILDDDPIGTSADSLTFYLPNLPLEKTPYKFEKINNDLLISFGEDKNSSVQIEDWFFDPRYRIEEIVLWHHYFGEERFNADEVEFLVEPSDVPTVSGDDSDEKLVGWTAQDILIGEGGRDTLDGRDGNDDLRGGSGDDLLIGAAGADKLAGGVGSDLLRGGIGGDVYFFAAGFGQDEIQDEGLVGEVDSIKFSQEITPSSLVISKENGDVLIVFAGSDDSIRIKRWDETEFKVEKVWFANGANWGIEEFLNGTVVLNKAPQVMKAIADREIVEDSDFFIQIPSATFSDPDSWDLLEYSVVLAGGDALPDWLQFNYMTMTLSGMPTSGNLGEISIQVTATDSMGLSVSDQFDLIVVNANDAPVAVDDYFVLGVGEIIVLSENDLLSNDYDEDVDDDLRIVDLGNADHGTAFLDGEGGVVFIPEEGYYGESRFIYVVADGSDSYSVATVNIVMEQGNHSPVLLNALPDQQIIEDQEFVFQLSAGAFLDADPQDILTYEAKTLNGEILPDWMRFDAADLSFTGLPGNDAVGSVTVQVTAVDFLGASATGTFVINVANVNDAPVLHASLPDLTAKQGVEFYFALPPGTFLELDAGDELSYRVSTPGTNLLPAWLVFDEVANSIRGVPDSGAVGVMALQVEAVDRTGASASAEFYLTVLPESRMILNGTTGRDRLVGGVGNDVIDGLGGADTLIGMDGDDTYYIDNTLDRVVESGGQGLDQVISTVSYMLADNVESMILVGENAQSGTGNSLDNIILGSIGANILRGGGGGDRLDGAAGMDVLIGDDGEDDLRGGPDDDSLSGGAGADFLDGEDGADSVYGGSGEDRIFGALGSDHLHGEGQADYLSGGGGSDFLYGGEGTDILDGAEGADYASGGEGDDWVEGGEGSDKLYGDAGADFIKGGDQDDHLSGGLNIDVLQGGQGADYLVDVSGIAVLDGGIGADSLTGGSGIEFFAGGAGNDSILLGSGRDVIAFNAGDGQDLLMISISKEFTLTLGGGIQYSDLALSRSGRDLVVQTGGTDKFTFQDWYRYANSRNAIRLQVIAESMQGFNPSGTDPLLDNKVEQFDFAALEKAFDASGQVSGWAMTDALLDAHLSGSDSEAIGGDLAYRYGLNSSLAGIGLNAAQGVLAAPSFGTSSQTLRPLQDLQQGTPHLS